MFEISMLFLSRDLNVIFLLKSLGLKMLTPKKKLPVRPVRFAPPINNQKTNPHPLALEWPS
jgi:hypothetical protein